MDRAMPADERGRIVAVLEEVRTRGGDYHRLRTRVAGKKSFVDVHILVPGTMSVHDGHDLAHRLEELIEAAMPHVEVLTHLEPLEDPRSWEEGEAGRSGSEEKGSDPFSAPGKGI